MTTSAQASLLRSSLQARAAYRQRRSSNANSLCSQKSAGSRESDRPFKGIFYDDVSEFESHMASHAVRSPPLSTGALSRSGFPRPAMPPGPRIEPCWPHFVGLMASPAGAVELLRCVSARVEAPIFAKNGFWAPCVRAKGYESRLTQRPGRVLKMNLTESEAI